MSMKIETSKLPFAAYIKTVYKDKVRFAAERYGKTRK